MFSSWPHQEKNTSCWYDRSLALSLFPAMGNGSLRLYCSVGPSKRNRICAMSGNREYGLLDSEQSPVVELAIVSFFSTLRNIVSSNVGYTD